MSATTEAAVRRSARELGYRPNAAAQALRRGTARAIALVVPDVTNPFFGQLLRGAQRAARAAGHWVALVDTENDRGWHRESFDVLRAGPVDGFLLFELEPPAKPSPGDHIVLIETESPHMPSVTFDVDAGATAAVGHLLALGHTRIGHLASAIDAPTFRIREAALRRELASAGIDPDQPRATAEFHVESATVAGHELIHEGVTAIVCDDDILAAGAYLAARDMGRAIPDELSIVGFDDLEIARLLDPPLTTVAADAELLGATAFGVLESRMAGRRTRRRTVLPTELVVRGSTAPA